MSNRWKVGERIQNRYEIHSIHEGGFGTVYLCYDHEFKEPVALKTPKEEHLGDKRFKDMFRSEAEAWVRLERHKNIVRAYYFIELENRPFIVMEYIIGDDMYGIDLRGWIAKGGLSLKTTLDFAVQFCLGMEHAQKKFKEFGRPFVHRDVKPGNILITRDRVLKVTDFGLVKALGETERGMGTLPYMSPEQFIKGAEVDIRSDIYAFGCVLFEMLSGRQPYEIDRKKYPDPHPDFVPVLYKEMHTNDPIPHIRDYVSSIPEGLDGLVFRCMAKKREGRFDDFGSIRQVLIEIYREHTGDGYEIEKIDDIKLEAWELVNKGISLGNLGYTDEELECYNRAIDLNPELAMSYNNRGNAYAKKGEYDMAIRDYNKAIDLNPELAKAYANCGLAYANKGEYDMAIRDYDRAIKLNTEFAGAYNNRGEVYRNKGDYDNAIRDYDRAIKLNTEFAGAYNNRGIIYYGKGEYDRAIMEFERAIELNPEYAEAYYNRGNAYDGKGEYGLAIMDYDRAIELNPEIAGAYNNRGLVYTKKGEYDLAIRDYDRAIELNPEFALAYYNRGNAYIYKNKYKEAIMDFEMFIRLAPPQYAGDVMKLRAMIKDLAIRNAEAYNSHGLAYANKGEYDTAIREYEMAIELNPEYAQAYFNCGLSYKNKNNYKEAIRDFKKFIELALPQYSEFVMKAKAMIKELESML